MSTEDSTTKPDALQILKALACGKPGCSCGASAARGHGLTHCLTHTDKTPSLSVNEDADKPLVYCQAGCSQEAVIAALRERGLWPDPPTLTVDELARAKGLSPTFLRGLGVADGKSGQDRQPCVDVPYSDEQGQLVAMRKRLRLSGEPRFLWRRGDHPIPYGLPRLREIKARLGENAYIILVEGESDCWSLWQAGIPALGIPGANTWRPEWIGRLQGIPKVFVWREPDQGGDTLARKMGQDFPDVWVIEAPPDAKDPSELWLAAGGNLDTFKARVRDLALKARPASELRDEALDVEAREAFDKAGPLLEDPSLLERITQTISARGYAGDPTAPLLAYVALTSRLLERPINLAFIAASAAGKNRAVDAALELMPASAYHLVRASSERALIYNDADYEHRTLIIAEADSLPEEGPAASAVRALACDNEMSYDVVEKDPETKRFTVRRVVKPGPTGVITTAIKPLDEQMSTRMLVVGLPDSAGQTRAILLTHAASVNGATPDTDTDDLVALQRWLGLAGDREVTVPFAMALAHAVPAELVRMRRDFRQLLTVIQAIALLYQRQRERDPDGRIVATLEDYALARALLLDTFTAAATGGVSGALRQTVEAVVRLYDGAKPLTVQAVGDGLGLSRDTTWHRVRRALDAGYLTNLETQRGRPAKIIPGDPLPERRTALPEPETLMGGVCVIHPETHSTIQPPSKAPICAESGGAVERAVELPFQPIQPLNDRQPAVEPVENRLNPPIQPPARPDPDTNLGPSGDVVERLNANPGEAHTHTGPPCLHQSAEQVAERWRRAEAQNADDSVCACCSGPTAAGRERCVCCPESATAKEVK